MLHQEFIQAILADPDDDAPRLIFADWLEEHGDPRCEFIRVQCELARLTKPSRWMGIYRNGLPAYSDPARAAQLRARQLELLMAHGKDWVAPLGSSLTGLVFCRGFAEGCNSSAASFLQNADRWFQHVPLRQVYLQFTRPDLRKLLNSPLLLRIDTLDLSGSHFRNFSNEVRSSLEDTDILQLAASPNLANLRRLGLSCFRLHDAECRALLDSPHLRKLETLCASLQSENMRGAMEARFGSLP